MYWMRGQHDKYCFIHISMHQTKLMLAGVLHAGGEQLFDYNWKQPKIQCSLCLYNNKTAQGAQDHGSAVLCLWRYSFLGSLCSQVCHKPQDMVTACKLCDIQKLNSHLTQNLKLCICFHLCHTYHRCFTVIYLEEREQLQEQRYKLLRSNRSRCHLAKSLLFLPHLLLNTA